MSKLLTLSVLGLSAVLSMSAPALADTKPSPTPKSKVVAVAKVPAKPEPKIYVVASGDSLSSIAEAQKLDSWRPLWNVNAEVTNPDLVFEGEKLTVPTEPTTARPLPEGVAVEPVAAASTPHAPVQHAAAPANYAGGVGGLLARIRQHESGGNYATNTGNGYYGAYQFNLATWRGQGGTGLPSDASPAEQDMRAQSLYNQRGCSPWPNTCY